MNLRTHKHRAYAGMARRFARARAVSGEWGGTIVGVCWVHSPRWLILDGVKYLHAGQTGRKRWARWLHCAIGG